MRYLQFIPIAGFIFFLSCRHSENARNTNDNTQYNPVLSDSSRGGNLVKAEAPDAVTTITQGYALPRFNDRLAQSPVNILSDSAVKDTDQNMALSFKTSISAIENLGHTIQLDFKEGSTTLANGKIYSPRQFHFHTPSEHLIDGMTFPMEMHIVNVSKDTSADNQPRYLVVAFLFKMGHENKFLKEFLKAIPAEEEKDSLSPGQVNFEDLFNMIPENEQGYFLYKGSLTTAPFTETVDWVIKKYILEASPEQIYTIEKMEGDNARHVQALYTRKVVSHD